MKNIPVLHVTEETLATAYEEALMKLHNEGTRFKTQYDKHGDPLSIDATMNITVLNPLKDPMIHKAFPGGIGDLREYVMELEGVKDHWVKNLNDPKDTRWEYTYHGRFANWGSWKEIRTYIPDNADPQNEGQQLPTKSMEAGDYNINQIELVVDKLCKQPFTRQAQMITWMPMLDMNIFDPPCLQSWWGRILEDNGTWYLNYNIRIRSNDAWGAYFMNSFGITMMTKELIADEIAKRTGKTVKLGRMNWQADSWHVYGKDIKQFEERLWHKLSPVEGERQETISERTYNFYDPDIQEMYNEATDVVLDKIKMEDNK
jgi:thymidylate synthase